MKFVPPRVQSFRIARNHRAGDASPRDGMDLAPFKVPVPSFSILENDRWQIGIRNTHKRAALLRKGATTTTASTRAAPSSADGASETRMSRAAQPGVTLVMAISAAASTAVADLVGVAR